MKVLSKHFGEIEIQEEHIIKFARGLMGLEEYTKYILIEFSPNSEIYWMQSIENPELCFIVTNPRIFKPDYILDVYEEDLQLIDNPETKDTSILCILNVSLEDQKITANLLGPIVINNTNNKAIQAVSKRNDYNAKYLVSDLKIPK